ncbi:MAG: hypothetical protein NTV05_00010 [Acidobacteria bacterium]|nr:hypothetical protein [Acidobacteriota bacterium]
MRKKDPIFWVATGIFLVAIVIYATTRDQRWLFLMIASYLLRPTLASLGVARQYVDERQMSIHYRSGNIAFAVMIVASVVLAVVQSSKGDHSWELFNIVIILGLASKALFNVVLVKNYREAGSRIIMAVGLLMLLFVAMENGATIGGLVESSPSLLIVGIGWLARKFPKTIGSIVFAVTAILLFVILRRGLTLGQIATALMICVPLILAGACLFAPDRSHADSRADAAPCPAPHP